MSKTDELLKIIDWSSVQGRIQISNQSPFPKRREIWWVNLGQNVGVEVNGKNKNFERPVLVIKVFNASSLFVAPLTSTVGVHKFLIGFNHLGQKRSINIFQLRTLSAKRFDRKISDISDADFERVIAAITEHILIRTETPIDGVSSTLHQCGANGTEGLSRPSSELSLGQRMIVL